MIQVTRVDSENSKRIVNDFLKRGEGSFDEIDRTVQRIIDNVRKEGDAALFDYTLKFDQVNLVNLKVTDEEMDEAVRSISPELLEVIKEAKNNIYDFHSQQAEKSWFINKGEGIVLGQQITPLERVGIYVPGGKAAYPSTVLMNAMPAIVAGVKEIVLVTPPGKNGKMNPAVLAASRLAGIREIYKVGGAQAIAALTYGTKTIKPVDKIVGPGNIYVARAKKFVFGKVDIDMIAGPSEICVIADEKAEADHVAADLLSQAEHDELAAAILITDCHTLAKKVQQEVESQLAKLDRSTIASQSIKQFGHIFIVKDLDEAFRLANEIAPEHLELMIDKPFEQLPRVRNAGAIFLGSYAPESLGDYWAGPNHTLPTSGTAKFSSPLGTYDFIKRSSVIYYERTALEKVHNQIIRFANEEGLTGHAKSIQIRFQK